jgi:hypothetical protein
VDVESDMVDRSEVAETANQIVNFDHHVAAVGRG